MKIYIFLLMLFIFSCTEPNNPPLNDPDTTSHDFIWRVDTIGTIGGPSNYLYDVSIIDNDNVWISGYIKPEANDTTYGLLHWTGSEWKPESFKLDLPYPSYVSNAKGIHAINDNDIWMASGSILHWDGQLASISYLSNTNLQHLWYNTDSQIYACGNHGLLLLYNGAMWQELGTGMDNPVLDVWGCVNAKTGSKKVLAAVSNDWWQISGEYKILSIHNNHLVDTLQWKWPGEKPLMSIWFGQDTPVYVAGSGVAVYNGSTWENIDEVPNYGMYKIRGSGWNNIFAVGHYGIIVHYNGSTWHAYNELLLDSGTLNSVAVTENMVIAAGTIGNYHQRGIIVTGFRKDGK